MTPAAGTMAWLKKLQAARAQGYPVHLTTDPAWLVDMAANRRAGWLEDPHAHGAMKPLRPRGYQDPAFFATVNLPAPPLPRLARNDEQRHLCQLAHRVNTPRLIVRTGELGELRSYLLRKLPDRFTTPDDE